MRIAICGSDDFEDYERLEEKCDKITSKLREIIVLTLYKPGAEAMARLWATKRRYVYRNFHPDIYRREANYGEAIEEMLKEAQLVICFGSSDDITEAAEELGIPVRRLK